MAVTISSSGPRGSKTYEVRVDGHLYHYTDTRSDAERAAREARRRRGNPSRHRRMTKLQRANAASKRSKKARIARALKEFLRKTNPAVLKRCNGARMKHNPGGSITIIPIKALRRLAR